MNPFILPNLGLKSIAVVFFFLKMALALIMAQSAAVAEYTDCISAER